MNKLQTALERALPIVAAAYGEQFGVNVVLSGTDAYTDGETIYLPLLNAMSDLREVLFGYLAHEAAHVRSSDFNTLKKCKSPMEKSCTNLIEDIRIERLIQEVFPGTQFTLNAMWSYIVEQGMSPPATPEDNEATQLFQYLLHRLRSEVLHRDASTPLAESSQRVVEQTFPVGFFVRLDGLLGKHLDNLTCSDDCMKLARAILKALKDAEEEERQQQQNQEQQQSSDSSQGDQSRQLVDRVEVVTANHNLNREKQTHRTVVMLTRGQETRSSPAQTVMATATRLKIPGQETSHRRPKVNRIRPVIRVNLKVATVLLCMSGSLTRPICQRMPLGSYESNWQIKPVKTTMANVWPLIRPAWGVMPEIMVIPVV